MKKKVYLDCPYKGSIAWATVMSASKEQLLIRKGYTEMAINTHTEEGNKCQIKFFTEELELINKRINKL